MSPDKTKSKTISIIVAIAEGNAIGKDNDLLCHLPDDLKWFKQNTMGHFVVMGKRTYLSLPKGALPGRTNIVITDDPADQFENCVMAFSIEDALEKMSDEKENFIIGGGSVYAQFMPYANKLYLTFIHKEFEADTFFPEIDFSRWKQVYEKSNLKHETPHTYTVFEKVD